MSLRGRIVTPGKLPCGSASKGRMVDSVLTSRSDALHVANLIALAPKVSAVGPHNSVITKFSGSELSVLWPLSSSSSGTPLDREELEASISKVSQKRWHVITPSVTAS
ncbi:hypothetical protein CRM22_001971 [Opisthorchis felineus]|uniref:Uncharacterized protein n=1 Tax=Opisthorchis felineus TaxID=147828 RepID=A0A4S2M872_OPIFE|nr:hypothetical protein CRM22_001971 [Opisthorchis felineus]